MPARELETDQVAPEVAPEAVAPAPAEPEAQFTQEGDLPAIAEGTGAMAAVTASELGFPETEPAVDSSHLDRGVHYWDSYYAACQTAGLPDKWKDHYRLGHTEAKGWSQPYERKAVNDFALKKGHSASESLRDFLSGLTITDYRCALLAEEVDEVVDELGERRFDQLFGSKDAEEDAVIPPEQRLHISSALYTTPLPDKLRAIAREADEKLNRVEEEAPAEQLEARVEEKPKSMEETEEPELVRQELGLEQADRELV